MRNGKWAMLANIFKPVILWMSGGVIVAGFAGYAIVDSYNATRSAQEASEVIVEKETPKVEKPAEVASLPKTQPEKQIETKPEVASKPAEQATIASVPEHPLPKFDILRVEQDGYAVIAGSAPAGSKVEILDGNTIIATEKAGSTNEFVVILDKPLTPGPHDLVIQATLTGGEKLVSAEAGIINIPDGKTELLAMVTEPGKASRILQLPDAKPEAAKEVAPEVKQEAKQQAQKETPKEVVAETPKEAPKVEKEPVVEMAKMPEQESAPAPAVTSAPVEVEEAKKEETQIASLEQKPKEQPAVEQPAVKPSVEAEEKPMATPAITEQPKQAEKTEEPKQIAKVENPKQIAKVVESAKPKVPVLIQAAEVEGEKIFIAGTGMSGTNVHIYIDGKFLGKTEVGTEGSYVFEGVGGLDAGRHAVRADMVGENGKDVIARAVVSLLHEPVGIDPVKVAKIEPASKMAEPAKDMAKMAVAKTPEAKSETIKPAMKKPAVKKEMAAIAPKPESAAAQPKEEPMKVAAVEDKIEMSSSVETAATPKKMEMAKPAAQMKKPAAETASDNAANVAEITTGSSVIIRKGDSLWRVSQRRYGQGVRYTTIFDANRDQIRDPNLIYPGQVFEIPDFKEKG